MSFRVLIVAADVQSVDKDRYTNHDDNNTICLSFDFMYIQENSKELCSASLGLSEYR